MLSTPDIETKEIRVLFFLLKKEKFTLSDLFGSVINTNLPWNAVMEGVIRISHLIELVYSQKIPKKLVKKILWYYLVTIPNYV